MKPYIPSKILNELLPGIWCSYILHLGHKLQQVSQVKGKIILNWSKLIFHFYIAAANLFLTVNLKTYVAYYNPNKKF